MNRRFLKEYPRLTIITPSYNQGQFLEETILSVLDQDYPNLEYIIIDGGSTDNTLQVIKKYERYLSYWVSESDRGQSHALNKGLQRASGDLVGWINSDDVYVRGAFRKVINAFSRNPDCILVHGDRILIDSTSNVYGWGMSGKFDPERSGFNVCSETAFWRRDVRSKSMTFKEYLRFAMDLEFFCRLYSKGEFIKLNSYLGFFRAHFSSKSTTIWDVAVAEAAREWMLIFGRQHDGWKIVARPSISGKVKLITKFLLNPRLVAYPYLYRRFILRRRGI
ncbi:MAG: glycosyltransferase [Glaciimonas sp.]|nr:glycosyltransferase [Glaciimonas sp.]